MTIARGMFTSLEVTQFGCIEHVNLKLTPLHAFIGPNDSGKSTLLKALQWCCWRTGP